MGIFQKPLSVRYQKLSFIQKKTTFLGRPFINYPCDRRLGELLGDKSPTTIRTVYIDNGLKVCLTNANKLKNFINYVIRTFLVPTEKGIQTLIWTPAKY
jgi:hypothetical protein